MTEEKDEFEGTSITIPDEIIPMWSEALEDAIIKASNFKLENGQYVNLPEGNDLFKFLYTIGEAYYKIKNENLVG